MKKIISFFVALLLLLNTSKAQITINGYYVSMPDTSIITSVSSGVPVFSIAGINTIVSNYTVNGFWQAFPLSGYQYLREFYFFGCTDSNLFIDLKAAYPQYFTYYEPRYEAILTGVAGAVLQNNISVYPNPAKDVLIVTNPSGGLLNIGITDITGRWVSQYRSTDVMNTLNISNLVNGQYYLGVYDKDGAVLLMQSFLKAE